MSRKYQQSMKYSVRLLAAGAAVLIGCAGCSQVGDTPSTQSTPGASQAAVDTPKISTELTMAAISTHSGSYTGNGDSALLDGILRVYDGCLVVESNKNFIVPFFAKNSTTLAGDKLVTGDMTYYVGDPVSFGGGFG